MSVHHRIARSTSLLALALTLAACGSDGALAPCPDTAAGGAGGRRVLPLPRTALDPLFDAAGRRHGVDPALLRAVAWVETRMQMVRPEHEDAVDDHHGRPAAWGVMALRGERLERAARLAGLEPDRVRREAGATIAAAAALLAEVARESGVHTLPADDWGPALELFSDIAMPAGRTAWVHDAVLPALTRARSDAGTTAAARTHGGTLRDCHGEPPEPPPASDDVVTVWRGSPNFNERAGGDAGRIAMIIVHTCEGAYIGCWSWLTNPASAVSAHYVIDEDGAEISHLVQESMRAWHIGAQYSCTLNHDRRCELEGVQSNHFTVGIEHAGFASQTTFPSTQIDVSARLACSITRAHAIPRDGQHIVAHGQLQPWNRTDPGAHWPWVRYLALVQRHCGEVVADDDATLNDATRARVSAPAVWTAAQATSGYHGHGYRWAPTAADRDDSIIFELFIDRAGSHTIEARWTAGSNRADAARFTVKDAGGGVVAEKQFDQRSGHDAWHVITVADLAAGWHRVELSRRGEPGSVVVADAVRARR